MFTVAESRNFDTPSRNVHKFAFVTETKITKMHTALNISI